MLGKLSVPGRPTSLDESRARAYCACSRCGWGLCGHFFPHLSFLFSFSLSKGDGQPLSYSLNIKTTLKVEFRIQIMLHASNQSQHRISIH